MVLFHLKVNLNEYQNGNDRLVVAILIWVDRLG